MIQCAPANYLLLSTVDGLSISILEQRGQAWAVYIHTGTVRQGYCPRYQYRTTAAPALIALNLPAGQYSAEWMDTRSGKAIRSDVISHAGGSVTWLSPAFSEDIVLRLARSNR